MNLHLLTILLLLFLPIFAEGAYERYIPDTFCAKGLEESDCSSKIEQACIRELGNKVKRNKSELILRLQNGSKAIFANSPEGFEGYLDSKGKPNSHYQLYAYLQNAGFYVLRVQYWEGTGYRFISEKDGTSVEIYEPPNFSPDRSLFFVAASDDIYHETTEELQIWSIQLGKISKKWSQTTKGWPPISASWISDKEIRLYEEGRVESHKSLGVIKGAKGSWTLLKQANGPTRH